ncbi:hypothetical protein M569_12402 [Genlisea aurea]|uniref:Uncharacterized protein n=1 Tax=Genlisea aurea TaxID=192259 RepID=S8DI36_9LAMI|nr:hypothetical protein M569_12402 [Genlisea aurea]
MSRTRTLELRKAPKAGSSSADGETNTDEIPSLPIPYHLNLPSLSVPYVYRVYQHLREINPAAYEPNLIAIGPYHHGKEKTSMMEGLKSVYLETERDPWMIIKRNKSWWRNKETIDILRIVGVLILFHTSALQILTTMAASNSVNVSNFITEKHQHRKNSSCLLKEQHRIHYNKIQNSQTGVQMIG